MAQTDSLYTLLNITGNETARKRGESKQEATKYFSSFFGERVANIIVANIMIEHYNKTRRMADIFSEAFSELDYQTITDIFFRATNGLPCRDKDTGELEELRSI